MLSLSRENFTGELRVYVEYRGVEAWIAKRPLFRNPGRDWQLWVRRTPGFPARTGKSPMRVALESHLKAWLLAQYHRSLYTLTFAELCRIAERTRRNTSTLRSDI